MTKTLHPYYDLGPVISQNAYINMVIGERGVGKTFGFIKRAIKRGIKYGEEFIYLRRYVEEMKIAKPNFFSELALHFPGYKFRINGNVGEWAEEDGKEWHRLVHFLTLSRAQSIKSTSFFQVRQIIFDEFILEKGLIRYLPNEAMTLIGLYKTVDRDRSRVLIYMLGNSASSTNPYFIEWNLQPERMDEFTVVGDNFMFIHLSRAKDFQESVAATPLGRFMAGTDYERYAGQNEFLDTHGALIGSKPSHATPQFNLETRFGTFSAWWDERKRVYYMQEKLIGWDAPMLTLLPERMDETKVLIDPRARQLARIRTAYRRGGSVYYDSPRTRNAVMEVFRR